MDELKSISNHELCTRTKKSDRYATKTNEAQPETKTVEPKPTRVEKTLSRDVGRIDSPSPAPCSSGERRSPPLAPWEHIWQGMRSADLLSAALRWWLDQPTPPQCVQRPTSSHRDSGFEAKPTSTWRPVAARAGAPPVPDDVTVDCEEVDTWRGG